ncbi:MAG: hypothetical protein M3537_04590 [Chloroflexota bacterium]|nr:hypothetical protein [Chloroflexota bacterium]
MPLTFRLPFKVDPQIKTARAMVDVTAPLRVASATASAPPGFTMTGPVTVTPDSMHVVPLTTSDPRSDDEMVVLHVTVCSVDPDELRKFALPE